MKKCIFTTLIASILMQTVYAQDIDVTTAYYQEIVEKGYDQASTNNISDEKNIEISEPNCAYINISNVTAMPTSKTDDLHAWFECYDGNGNYFKKKVILNAQGNSSMLFPKKNFATDFCEDDWIGDKTTDITIGNWVSQDGFHFKAYYIDYFRGIGTVGYKLYDDVVADHDSFQSRNGLTDYDTKARCYPDGFPCVVYLNGDFYGVFAWQLKKHRKNTSQTKDNANHIHLDGTLNDATFWKGTVDWTKFEVRNPKTLMCTTTVAVSGYKYVEITDDAVEIAAMGDSWVDAPTNPKDMSSEELSASSPLYYKYVTSKGKIKYYKLMEQSGYEYAEYDGNSPTELIDEKSEYYNASNSNHVLTAEVKNNILRVSGYWNELNTLKNSGADFATMRAAIAERFDITSMVDYFVFSLVTSNTDGFEKNWQWLTYDGKKWFVTPYDLDCTFGNVWTGGFLLPAYWSFSNTDYTLGGLLGIGPCHWIKTYYWPEVKERYAALRQNGVFTTENIMKYIKDWYNRIGDEAYASEKQKWSQSYCYNELVCNPNWTTSDDYSGYNSLKEYDNNTTYNKGDKCTLDYKIWTATGTTTGVKPYSQLGFTDGLDRIHNWIADRLAIEDRYLNYTSVPTTLDIARISNPESDIESIYTIYGTRSDLLQKGLNIIKFNSGKVIKVYNQK